MNHVYHAIAQVVFGVTAVIMPGTVLGDGAVLGAIASADIGQELGGNTLYMGVPATATTKHETGLPFLLLLPASTYFRAQQQGLHLLD